MLIKNISNVINNKIDCNALDNSNYISTENMLENFGGIKEASNVPSGKCTAILKKDILLSNIRPYFKKLWYSKFNGGCSNDVIALRVNNKLAISKYVFYALSSNKFFDVYVANCKGTKMPRGNKDVLLNYDIPTKSLSEQQHIVDTIGSVDNLIEKYEEIIVKDLNLIKTKFDIMCTSNTTKTLLKDMCQNAICGTTPSTKNPELWNGNIPFITTPDMVNNTFVFNTERYVVENNKIKNRIIDSNTISVSCIGTIGVIAMATGKSLTNQQINSIIPFKNQIFYLYTLLNKNVARIKSMATGSATPNISKEEFLKLELDKCDDKYIYNFNSFASKIYENIKQMENKIIFLKSTKEQLLKKYFG